MDESSWRGQRSRRQPGGGQDNQSADLLERLKRFFASFTSSNPNGVFKIGNENLSIADLTGLSRLKNRINDGAKILIGAHDFDFHFWNKVDRVFRTTVDFRVTFLTPKSSNLCHGHAMNSMIRESIFYVLELKVTYDSFYFLHDPTSKQDVFDLSTLSIVSMERPQTTGERQSTP